MTRIFVVAGEASGDMYAAQVVSALRDTPTAIEVQGWGGDAMAAAGVDVLKHHRTMAFMGFWEVAKNLRTIQKNFRLAHRQIEAFQPDLLLTVDFPGFNMRLARWAHARGIRTAHYISPAIWAWKPGRMRALKRDMDHVFVTLPFEQAMYDEAQVPCTFVGHPLLDFSDSTAPVGLSESHDTRPILALLPGSRAQEVEKMLPVMLAAAKQLPDARPIVGAAPGAPEVWYAPATEAGVEVLRDATRPLLRAARAGLVTSGTATLEAGLAGLPTIIGYKTSAITYWIARRLAQISFIGLPNIILERAVYPERIQSDCHAQQLAKDLAPLLAIPDSAERLVMLEQLQSLRAKLGTSGAGRRVAEQIIKWLCVVLLTWLSTPQSSMAQSNAPVLRVGVHGGQTLDGWALRIPASTYQRVDASGTVLDTVPIGEWLPIEPNAGWLAAPGQYVLIRPTAVGDVLELRPPGKARQLHTGALHLDGRNGRGIRAILETSLERYLPGVLSAEAGKGHDLAFYEAQAIVSRTYTVQALRRHQVEGFHVCDQVHCQVYHGLTTATDTMYNAVANTRHHILIDDRGQPITAAFHSNCGGHTQGAEAVWQRSLPYLRCVRDTFCAGGAHSHWEKELAGEAWRTWLTEQRGGLSAGPTSMFPRKRSPHLLDSTHAIRAAAARSAFDLPSAFFVAHDQGDKVALTGQGFGHGIGMCQEGAMARAAAGAEAWEILNAYYQNVHLADARAAWRMLQKVGK